METKKYVNWGTQAMLVEELKIHSEISSFMEGSHVLLRHLCISVFSLKS